MKGKTLNRDKIVSCQSKITMALKRKTELKEDLRKMKEQKLNFVPNRSFSILLSHDYFWKF